MLQDAVWANTEKLKDPNYQAQTVKFLTATIKGWAYCRDNPEKCRDLVVAKGSKLGKSHQLWQMNEVNKLIWPNTTGIGHAAKAAVARTANIAKTYGVIKKLPTGATDYHWADIALDQLKKAHVDVYGHNYKPIKVTVTPGGK
jgi:NitT/TauT family transport system substrate-binding protein